MSLVDTSRIERKLAENVDPKITSELAISTKAGGLEFVNMSELMQFSKLMALSSIAIPKHLRGNPGACLGICIQAIEWQMSPYAVANKSYSVNDRLAYEAQLIEAVILRRAPIKGRPKVEYEGNGDAKVCRVWAELRDEPGEIVEYRSPPFGRITPKNSPLWKTDPDQQQFYYSVRAWCRRHFPDVLLGVYARDELPEPQRPAAAVGVVRSGGGLTASLDRLADGTPAEPEVIDPDTGEVLTGDAEERPDVQIDAEAEMAQHEPESEVMPSDDAGASSQILLAGSRTSNAPDRSGVTPPRPAQSEPGGAESAKVARDQLDIPPELDRREPRDEAGYRAMAERRIAEMDDPARSQAWLVSDQQHALRRQCGVSKEAYGALMAMAKARAAELRGMK